MLTQHSGVRISACQWPAAVGCSTEEAAYTTAQEMGEASLGLELQERPQAFCLYTADGDFGLFLIVHFQLKT